MNRVYALVAAALIAVPLFAAGDMRGHWSGTLDTPAGQLTLEIDLDKPASGWIGSVSIPAQGITGLPLEAISFADGKGTFRFKGAPGDPTFTGALSADGGQMDGNFSQGTLALPLKLTKSGEAKVDLPKTSAAVAPEFVGKWEGVIEAGPGLHIELTISNGSSGAEAQMVSIDQGHSQIPVSAITQKGPELNLEVRAVGGGYVGSINKEGTEMTGTWTQGLNSIPLQFKKSK